MIRKIFLALLALAPNAALAVPVGTPPPVSPALPATMQTLGTLPYLAMSGGRQAIATSHPPDQVTYATTNVLYGTALSRVSPMGAKDLVVCVSGWRMAPQETGFYNQVYTAGSGVIAGGTGYAVNDVVVFQSQAGYAAGTGTYAAPTALPAGVFRAIKIRVTAVTAGAITGFDFIDRGIYLAPPTAALSQVSTTGSGSTATLTVTTNTGYAEHVRLAIDPVYGVQTNPVPVTWNAASALWNNATGGAMVPNQDALIPVGQDICSDPIPVYIPPGGKFDIRGWWDGYYASGYLTTNALDGHVFGGTGTADQTTQGTFTFANASGTQLNGPSLILGTPITATHTWGLTGDSIEWGSGNPNNDLGDTSGNVGWFQRAVFANGETVVSAASLSNAIKYLMVPNTYYYGGSTITTSGTAGAGLTGEFDLFDKAKVTDFFDGLGTNDAVGNTPAATFIGYKQQLYTLARAKINVSKIGTMTLLPRASSGTNLTPVAGCKLNGQTNWNINGSNTNGIEIYNADLRIGLLSSGTWDLPPSGLNIGSSPISPGTVTVTPSAMTITGTGGGVFNVIPGAVLMVEPGGANQETVTVTANNGTSNSVGYPLTTGTTFTAVFAKSHAASASFIVYSPLAYYPTITSAGAVSSTTLYPSQTINPGGADFVVDWSPTMESATGSCLWATPTTTNITAPITGTGSQVVPVGTLTGTYLGTTFTIGIGTQIVLDAAGANPETLQVTAVGTNTITIAPAFTHLINSTVTFSLTGSDGVHPVGAAINADGTLSGYKYMSQTAALILKANE